MEATSQTYTPNKKASFQAAPVELKIFLLFSVLAVLLELTVRYLGSQELFESIIPYTGTQISTVYSFCAIAGYFFFLGYSGKPFMQRNILIFLLTVSIISGLISFIRSIGADTFNNPYLTVSTWQPIWTILIPAIWIAILLNPRMTRYCEQLSEINYSK